MGQGENGPVILEAITLNVTQKGDSVWMIEQGWANDGPANNPWLPIDFVDGDSTYGSIRGDSLTLCTPDGSICPNGIGYLEDSALALYDTVDFPLAGQQPPAFDTANNGVRFVRGRWAPPPPAPNASPLTGTFLSDSLDNCDIGTVQIALVIQRGANAAYQSTEYDRQCGADAPGWQSAVLMQIDTGSVSGDTLALSPYADPNGSGGYYYGPFFSGGWRLVVTNADSLADVTPVSLGQAWTPAAFMRSDSTAIDQLRARWRGATYIAPRHH